MTFSPSLPMWWSSRSIRPDRRHHGVELGYFIQPEIVEIVRVLFAQFSVLVELYAKSLRIALGGEALLLDVGVRVVPDLVAFRFCVAPLVVGPAGRFVDLRLDPFVLLADGIEVGAHLAGRKQLEVGPFDADAEPIGGDPFLHLLDQPARQQAPAMQENIVHRSAGEPFGQGRFRGPGDERLGLAPIQHEPIHLGFDDAVVNLRLGIDQVVIAGQKLARRGDVLRQSLSGLAGSIQPTLIVRRSSTRTRSTRSMPQGSWNSKPGPGFSGRNAPKRRTTARSPGLTSVKLVARVPTANSRKPIRTRRMTTCPLQALLGPVGPGLAVGGTLPKARWTRRLKEQVE